MTLAITVAANAVLAIALLAALAYVMNLPRRFRPPTLALVRAPRTRPRPSAQLHPSNRPLAMG
jgi:hypothetical protein